MQNILRKLFHSKNKKMSAKILLAVIIIFSISFIQLVSYKKAVALTCLNPVTNTTINPLCIVPNTQQSLSEAIPDYNGNDPFNYFDTHTNSSNTSCEDIGGNVGDPFEYSWMSILNEPQTTSINLPYNFTGKISLQFNIFSIFCHLDFNPNVYYPNPSSSSSTSSAKNKYGDLYTSTNYLIKSLNTTLGTIINNPTGTTLTVPLSVSNNAYTSKYAYGSSSSFQLELNNISQSQNIQITAGTVPYEESQNSYYQCVEPGNTYDSRNPTLYLNNITFNDNCSYTESFNLQINILPPPTVQSNLKCYFDQYAINNSTGNYPIDYYISFINIFNLPINWIPNSFPSGTINNNSGIIPFPNVPGEYSIKFMYNNTTMISIGNVICANYPYFQVNGSDTQVGLGFCGISNNSLSASIYSWNHNGLSNNYNAGAGDQYGSISPGFIFGFDSSNINNNVNPLGLSFSNINNNPFTSNQESAFDNTTSGLFGGFFKSLPVCGFNYFSNLTNQFLQSLPQPPSSFIGNNVQGRYYINNLGQQNSVYDLNGVNLTGGSNVVIYAQNENIHINNNILLNNSNIKSNISNISSFRLIDLDGNIIISPNVSKVDGIFIAEPNKKGQNGVIYTCGENTPTTNCNNQLVVNGALDSNSIKLWRTGGTVDSNPAEIINQPPSTWLSAINSPGPLKINSIQNLPPVF